MAEPPSVEGTAGGQVGDAEPAVAVAVEFADWVEVSGISPGNRFGDCDEVAEDELSTTPLADTVDGKEDVGTLSGSDPTVSGLSLV